MSPPRLRVAVVTLWAIAASLPVAVTAAPSPPSVNGSAPTMQTAPVPSDLATPTTVPPAAPPSPVAVGSVLSLARLVELARQSSPALAASRAGIDAAQAGLLTAGARPNPEIDVQAGRQSASGGAMPGASGLVGLLQPIERPALRESRRQVAAGALDTVRAQAGAFERELLAELKLGYYEVLRLQAAARLAEEDLVIADQIRSRVQVRVGTGEAPRFELIRADAERLNAQRAVQAVAARVDLARAELRRRVGPGLPAAFEVAGSIDDPVDAPPAIDVLRASMLDRHPEIVAARAALRTAQARLDLERERRKPGIALRASVDRVPDAVDSRIGVVIQVPVFDRREGPIAEAAAELARSRFALADLELALGQSLEAAWQRYRIALEQVAAYESGILREAEAAVRVAEAAYRFGERGILDFLDAQRTFRTLRNELNATRYDLRAALVELERLRAETE